MSNLLNLIRIGNWEIPWDLETGLFWLLVAQVALIVFMVIVFAIIMHRINKRKEARVQQDELTGISLDTHAVKQQFTVGEEFTCEGLVVVAHYKNSVDKIVVDYKVLPPDLSKEGEGCVGIMFGERSAVYNVSVVAPVAEPEPMEEAVEAPAEEPVAEPAPVEVLVEAPAEAPAEEDGETHTVLPFDSNATQYDMSFAAKLIQSSDEVKAWYAELRNELLSYKKVKSRRSWKRESYHLGRQNLVRFSFRGSTLCVYFALDYAELEGSKYKVETVEVSTSYADTPCMYRMKNDRRVRYAKELIAMVMERVGAEWNEEYVPEDIRIPYEETEALIDKGLIKVNGVSRKIISQDTPEEVATAAVPEDAGDGEVSAEEPVVEEIPEEVTTEEPVAEEVPAEEPTVELIAEETAEEEPTEEEAEEEAEELDEDFAEGLVGALADGRPRYNKSFTAKLIQSSDQTKTWYAELKNDLLTYKKVKSRMSWKRESFRLGRNIAARFGYRGRTLCIYLPLDPAAYQDTKYKVEDVSEYASYADTPCMYRLKNERRTQYAMELIAELMNAWGVSHIERADEDYYLPYEENEPLIERGLIKVTGASGQTVPQNTAEEVATTEAPAEEVAAADASESVAESEVVAEEVPAEEPTEEPVAEEVPAEEPTEEPAVEEVPVEEPTEEPAVEEVPVEEPTEEPAVEEVPVEEPTEEPVAEEVPVEEPTEEPAVEEVPAEEPAEQPAEEEEPVVEELSKREIRDVETYEETKKDEDGIEVVGVMFRRRGRKVYWFDPAGKTWEKGEIAFYRSPDNPPQEVIVVDNAKLSPSKLHLPLKPLYKAIRRPQSPKKR